MSSDHNISQYRLSSLLLQTTDTLRRLLSPELPTGRSLHRVVEQYFANVHPLRCFAFVHKPSFMRQLDRGFASDDESALLHIICAHGAKFLLLGSGAGDLTPPPPPVGLRGAGNQWARRAEFLLLANFGKISVQRLMVSFYDGGWGKTREAVSAQGFRG